MNSDSLIFSVQWILMVQNKSPQRRLLFSHCLTEAQLQIVLTLRAHRGAQALGKSRTELAILICNSKSLLCPRGKETSLCLAPLSILFHDVVGSLFAPDSLCLEEIMHFSKLEICTSAAAGRAVGFERWVRVSQVWVSLTKCPLVFILLLGISVCLTEEGQANGGSGGRQFCLFL